MSGINDGLTAWQMTSNHNHMVDFQRKTTASSEAGVEIAYFAHSAIRITSPSGLSVMLDPWRNHPGGSSFFFHDFPKLRVDIGICTHAHFDHDALHRLDAHVLIDRLIGQYIFADMNIFGIADKHATDFSATTYDIGRLIKEFQGVDIHPPDNPRSWDNCLVIVETGDLRILHWGDNRADLPEAAWDMLGDIDILFLPLDDSQHVISYEMADAIMARLKPSITVPHTTTSGISHRDRAPCFLRRNGCGPGPMSFGLMSRF